MLKTGESVGIGNIGLVKNGFAKVDIVIPNSSCPSFKGDTFIFSAHFDTGSITKAVAKENNELQGAHLRRFPMQLSALTSQEFCLMNPNQSVGTNAVEMLENGFAKVNVTIPSPACPGFEGEVFAFSKHFNFD